METFIHKITHKSLSECSEHLDNLIIDKNKITFNNENYQRHLIYANNDYAIFVISWSAGQSVSYHSHSSNGCLFRLISGMMQETRLLKNDKEEEIILIPESGSRYIDNSIAIHKILALEDSISLHVYSPAHEAMKRPFIDLRSVNN